MPNNDAFLFHDNANADDDELITRHDWTSSDGKVRIAYHLAFLAAGHGDSLWNASVCVANHFCLLQQSQSSDTLFGDYSFPWPPTSALEFGAGAGLPSLALVHLGCPKVVVTDRRQGNESAFEALEKSIHCEELTNHVDRQKQIVRLEAHTWGESVDSLLRVGSTAPEEPQKQKQQQEYQLLIASDCIYNPTYHRALLTSARALLADGGLFVVAYSLHKNVPTEQVLHFFDLAARNEFGLGTVVNEFTQHYPGQAGIGGQDPERGAVYVKVLARTAKPIE